jgi:hypothetical protein
MKICRICNIEKDLSSFHKKTSNKDGYNSECKQCRHIRYVNKKKNGTLVYVEEQKKKEHTMFIALMVTVITIALIGITR